MQAMLDQLVDSAGAFEALGGYGAPRIDFIADMSQEKIWFNELNANLVHLHTIFGAKINPMGLFGYLTICSKKPLN